MGTAFFNGHHKKLKLDGTICLYDGEPYHINASDAYNSEHTVRLIPIDGRRQGRVNIDDSAVDYRDDKFDYKPTPLGYTNYRGNAYYMGRLPTRQAAQGLSLNSVCTIGDGPSISNITSWFYSREIYECIKGIYLSYAECEKILYEPVEGAWLSAAFSRTFAIGKLSRRAHMGLLHRGSLIATKTKSQETWILDDSKDLQFILGHLKRLGVKVDVGRPS